MTLQYFIRKPKYPVMAIIDGNVLAGLSGTDLENQLKKVDSFKKEHYDVIDATGAVWIFSPIPLFISPLSLKKKRTKQELIDLVNNRTNKSEEECPYSAKSISSKRYETVYKELIKILKA